MDIKDVPQEFIDEVNKMTAEIIDKYFVGNSIQVASSVASSLLLNSLFQLSLEDRVVSAQDVLNIFNKALSGWREELDAKE